jgi:hypothetical protein
MVENMRERKLAYVQAPPEMLQPCVKPKPFDTPSPGLKIRNRETNY